jgi:hypothetical protein
VKGAADATHADAPCAGVRAGASAATRRKPEPRRGGYSVFSVHPACDEAACDHFPWERFGGGRMKRLWQEKIRPVLASPSFWYWQSGILLAIAVALIVRNATAASASAAAEIFRGAASLAWPGMILSCAIYFGREIRSLAPRISEVGVSGVKIAPLGPDKAEQQKIEAERAVDAASIQLKDIPGLSRTEAIAELEKRLHALLTAVSAEERVDRLVRLLAESRLEAEFERIYRVIYGSQIAGLRILNMERRVSIEDARKRFEPIAAAYPEAYRDYGFDGWLGFLINTGLVERKGDMLELSPLGRDFLLFLTARGMREDKPF